jgi:ATP-dependent 26S proteasome regulatory subunit
MSKYLGDTAKHIKAAFQAARENGAILFFDEADSLLSKRVATGESCSTSINQNRNCLMVSGSPSTSDLELRFGGDS